jgi:hypothetical protein
LQRSSIFFLAARAVLTKKVEADPVVRGDRSVPEVPVQHDPLETALLQKAAVDAETTAATGRLATLAHHADTFLGTGTCSAGGGSSRCGGGPNSSAGRFLCSNRYISIWYVVVCKKKHYRVNFTQFIVQQKFNFAFEYLYLKFSEIILFAN